MRALSRYNFWGWNQNKITAETAVRATHAITDTHKIAHEIFKRGLCVMGLSFKNKKMTEKRTQQNRHFSTVLLSLLVTMLFCNSPSAVYRLVYP